MSHIENHLGPLEQLGVSRFETGKTLPNTQGHPRFEIGNGNISGTQSAVK